MDMDTIIPMGTTVGTIAEVQDRGIIMANQAIATADQAITTADQAINTADRGIITVDRAITREAPATTLAAQATTRTARVTILDTIQGITATKNISELKRRRLNVYEFFNKCNVMWDSMDHM